MIQNTIRKEVYEGDGSRRTWDIPFAYTSEEDVKIYTVINDVQTEVTENFSIHNDVITYPTVESGLPAVDSETKILVIRKTPLTQLESSAETPFTSSDIERALDKVTLEIQDIKEDVDRAVKAPEWSEDSVDTVITDMKNDIGLIDNKVSAETTNRMSADSVLLGQINDINSKIPSTASSTNKLADEQYVRQHAGNSTWGYIQGTLSDQTDLKNALDTKANTSDIPAAQVQSDWEQNDSTKADYIKNKPDIPVVPTNVSAFNNDAGYLTQHQDISGKANLSGGNSFSGKQQIYQGEGVDYAITFNKAGVPGTAGFTVGANGVVLSAPSNNLDINSRTVFKNITTLGNIAGTTQSLSAFTVEGCYTANLNGTATIKLPTPTSTQAMKENTINILLNVIGGSNIIWQDTNSNGINANNCMTTFAVGKYLIKLRYNNTTSNWIGEVLKQTDTESPVKLLLHFNQNYSDSSENPITLTAYGQDSNFPAYGEGKFDNTYSIRCYTNKYLVPSSTNSKLNLGTGDFTVSFWVKKEKVASNVQNDFVMYADNNNKIGMLGARIGSTSGIGIDPSNFPADSGWYFIALTRSSGTVYYFVNGYLKATKSMTGNFDFSASTVQFVKGYHSLDNKYTYFQDLLVRNTCDYTGAGASIDDKVFDVPTTPYSISEQSLPDYHDDTKADKSTVSTLSTSVNTNTYNISQLQTQVNNLSFVEFVLALPSQNIKTDVIYCVPLNETDLDGHTIIEQFIYHSNTWYAVGAFSTNIDASTLVLKSMFEFDSDTGTLNINLEGV